MRHRYPALCPVEHGRSWASLAAQQSRRGPDGGERRRCAGHRASARQRRHRERDRRPRPARTASSGTTRGARACCRTTTPSSTGPTSSRTSGPPRGPSSSPSPGLFATWLGETRTEIGRPLIWYDVGSGFPVAPASGGYQFPLAGKYAWECLVCSGIERTKLQGTMYVIGPRVDREVQARLPGQLRVIHHVRLRRVRLVRHGLHPAHHRRVRLRLPGRRGLRPVEPRADRHRPRTRRGRTRSACASRTTPAGTAEITVFFEVPYVRPGNPEPNPIADTGQGHPQPDRREVLQGEDQAQGRQDDPGERPAQPGAQHQGQRAHEGRPDQGAAAQGQEDRRRLGQHDHQHRDEECPSARRQGRKARSPAVPAPSGSF